MAALTPSAQQRRHLTGQSQLLVRRVIVRWIFVRGVFVRRALVWRLFDDRIWLGLTDTRGAPPVT